MENVAFRNALMRCARVVNEFTLTSGDPGPIPVTKVAGEPWWPRGTKRPRCNSGHAMSFVMQVLFRDVPHLSEKQSILSFHYCRQCALEGKMSHGWYYRDKFAGYDVSIFNVEVMQSEASMKYSLVFFLSVQS
jgi:uncharacterized protein YwqG